MPKPKKKHNPVQEQKLVDAQSYNNFVGLLRNYYNLPLIFLNVGDIW